ncbi:MAG TPA: histidine phosphatase family protein [Alphaproteobacteria bacterium]|nr:histidine phosphatase family protein [Alphaproteobacteria bacterium]
MNVSTPKREKPCFIIVRHGQSITNVNRSIHNRVSDPAVWLTEKGRQQARQAGRFLADYFAKMPKAERPQRLRIMRSTYRRARQTARLIEAELRENSGIPHIDLKDLDRLRELEFGYSGHPEAMQPHVRWLSNLLRFQGFKYFAPRAGGESPAWMEPRVRSALDAMFRDFRENGITHFVVPNHGLTTRIIVRALMGYNNQWYENEPNPGNCAIRIIDGGYDKGYVFPNPNGQWEADWREEPEDKTKLNPDGLFFSEDEMRRLIKIQETRPAIMADLDNLFRADPKLRASDAIRLVLNE